MNAALKINSQKSLPNNISADNMHPHNLFRGKVSAS